MTRLRCIATTFFLSLSFLCTPASAASTLIELSSDASHPATNDLIRATAAAEATDATPGELSKQINGQIAQALKLAKSYPSVKTRSGNTNSYPIYTKIGKIESWRMRSELILESGDTAAISELLGKLQDSLGVANLVLLPSPETRKAAENAAILDALAAFKERAALISGSMNKSYHIKQLNVNTNGRVAPPMFQVAARSMSADAVSMPVESGESQISATVSGQIELE